MLGVYFVAQNLYGYTVLVAPLPCVVSDVAGVLAVNVFPVLYIPLWPVKKSNYVPSRRRVPDSLTD